MVFLLFTPYPSSGKDGDKLEVAVFDEIYFSNLAAVAFLTLFSSSKTRLHFSMPLPKQLMMTVFTNVSCVFFFFATIT